MRFTERFLQVVAGFVLTRPPVIFLLCGICCKLAKCSMFIRSQLQVHYVFKIFLAEVVVLKISFNA